MAQFSDLKNRDFISVYNDFFFFKGIQLELPSVCKDNDRGSAWYFILSYWDISELPWWLSGKESACQCKTRKFNQWIGMIPRRRAWQPTPVFLPGEFHGQSSLESYSPWALKESGTTEWLILYFQTILMLMSKPHSEFLKCLGIGNRPKLELGLCCFLAGWPWASHFPLLALVSS